MSSTVLYGQGLKRCEFYFTLLKMPASKNPVGRPVQTPEYEEGETATKKFEEGMKRILSVSKEEILELEKQDKEAKKPRKKLVG